MNNSVLVVGASSSIGAHMVRLLTLRGYQVTAFDLGFSGCDAMGFSSTAFIGEPVSQQRLYSVFAAKHFDAVIYFPAIVPALDSEQELSLCYQRSLVEAINLLGVMAAFKSSAFVFSSSAAVYGNCGGFPVDESHPVNPINPFGRACLMLEQILTDYDQAYALRSVSLRCFSTVGVSFGQLQGYYPSDSSLISQSVQAASGRLPFVPVFGNTYPTPDGTCVRDYTNFRDVCTAHLLALEYLLNGGVSQIYNVGCGQAYSVNQVLDCVRQITGQPVLAKEMPERVGDVACLISNARRITVDLGWQARHSDMKAIIEEAWQFEKNGRFSEII